MKSFVVAVTAVLFGAVALFAEPKRGREGLESYHLYESSNIVNTGNASTSANVSLSGYLSRIIVSSPSVTTGTGGSTITFCNAQGSATNPVFSMNISTNVLSGSNVFDLGIYFSSGISTVFNTTGTPGAVTAIFQRGGYPSDAKIWQSSYTLIEQATQTIARGPVLLHKVIVTEKGTGPSSLLRVHNAFSASPSNVVAEIALTTMPANGYTYDVMLTSGLTIVGGLGTGARPGVLILYKENPSRDWEYWMPMAATSAYTTRVQTPGKNRMIFGGVVIGREDTNGLLSVFDSSGTATKTIGVIDMAVAGSKNMYDVQTSSGLTATNVGGGMGTILYREGR